MSMIRKDQKIMLMVCFITPVIFGLQSLDGFDRYSFIIAVLIFLILIFFSEIKINKNLYNYFDQILLVSSSVQIIFLFDKFFR